MFAATCHVSLKDFSRRRLSDLLEDAGRVAWYDKIIAHEHLLILTTGTIRAMLAIVVILATTQWMADYFEQGMGLVHLLVSFAVALALMLVFFLGLPVSWARYRKEALLARSAPVLLLLMRVMLPVVKPLQLIDPVVRRVSGVDLDDDDDDQIAEEVLSAIEEHEEGQSVDEAQKDMLEAVLELPKTSAGEIMTPRTEVKGIEIDADLQLVKADVLAFGHSRIPVYHENLDDIRGILYAKDLIKYLGDGQDFHLDQVLREVYLVPESKPVFDLLAEFKTKKVHLAIVLDEYGGTAGLITIEDILEEIVGDIHDEHETTDDTPELHHVDETTAIVDAKMHIDDVNDELDIELPEEEDYETLGGFVFSTLGHVPEVGESFDHDEVRVTVMEAERTKVLKVRLEKLVVDSASDTK